MSKAELEAANYRMGTDNEKCRTCHFYDPLRHQVGRGICTMFAVVVGEQMVCDKWEPNAQVRMVP